MFYKNKHHLILNKEARLPVLEFPTMNERPLLVLASNSPRRKELIALAKLPFETIAANVDETPRADESPRDYVLRLAEEKARASSLHADVSQVVIAADTTVVDAGALLGKPTNPSEAKRMLRQLRGRVHQVYTGIAALRVSDGHLVRDLCVTDVLMRDYSDEEIEAYVATGDPLDKAGAYAIQHTEFQPVASTTGCFTGVMGLPLCHVTRLLWQMDVPAYANVLIACQSFYKHECPVFKEILSLK